MAKKRRGGVSRERATARRRQREGGSLRRRAWLRRCRCAATAGGRGAAGVGAARYAVRSKGAAVWRVAKRHDFADICRLSDAFPAAVKPSKRGRHTKRGVRLRCVRPSHSRRAARSCPVARLFGAGAAAARTRTRPLRLRWAAAARATRAVRSAMRCANPAAPPSCHTPRLRRFCHAARSRTCGPRAPLRAISATSRRHSRCCALTRRRSVHRRAAPPIAAGGRRGRLPWVRPQQRSALPLSALRALPRAVPPARCCDARAPARPQAPT